MVSISACHAEDPGSIPVGIIGADSARNQQTEQYAAHVALLALPWAPHPRAASGSRLEGLGRGLQAGLWLSFPEVESRYFSWGAGNPGSHANTSVRAFGLHTSCGRWSPFWQLWVFSWETSLSIEEWGGPKQDQQGKGKESQAQAGTYLPREKAHSGCQGGLHPKNVNTSQCVRAMHRGHVDWFFSQSRLEICQEA